MTPNHLLVGTGLWVALVAGGGDVARAAGRPSPLPSVAPSLGRPPHNCPMTNLVHERPHDPGEPGGGWIGGGALIGYSLWSARGHRATLTFGHRTKYGYPQKVGWQLSRGTHATVTLRGWNLRTGQRIWFGNSVSLDPARRFVAWPVALVSEYHAPKLLFVPAAGCYVINAQWKTGSWVVPFSAGCWDGYCSS
jgi:hypothetical protein